MKKSSTSFADTVRLIVRKIPSGKTMSYKEVAGAAGSPKAARAVARVMAMNYDETIPCHRVVCSNGTLGGYNRGGSITKGILLQREGVTLR
ncbi:MAG: MGMT family protein [Candidatus Pacebacteria bacterium]|nr:MGMT family protein [Candidatus Paceibacterota bacterium]MCF7857058.1 MGMT family protein [Candidatus Paceibacterota bacterium]